MGRRAYSWLFVGVWMSAKVASAGALPCRDDDRLAETAASLLLSGEPISAGVLLARAREHGFDGVSVHARESQAESSLVEWLANLRLNREGVLVCGEASTESRRLLLASVRGGSLTREGDILRGALEKGFHEPSLVVETGDGELKSMPVTVDELRKGFALPRELAPRRVQLIAESASGPRPIAEIAFVARETPQPVEASGPKTRSIAALVGQVDGYRRSAGVPTLRENRLLGESAQRHAQRLCELGKLAHRLEGEDPEARLRREHVGARGVGEVLARAETSDRAFQALLESPSHRMALSRRDFTDVGVGQTTDAKGQVCLVVLLASWPRRLP